MQKIALGALFFILVQTQLYAKEPTREFYLSPGFSLGYTFGDGLTWGGQISMGTFKFEEGEGLAWGNMIGPVVGLTAGYRGSRLGTIKYLDAQINAGEIPVWPGIGLGSAWVTPRGTNDTQLYFHLKGWGWLFGALQVDRFFNKTDSFYSVSGVALLPVPVSRLGNNTGN